MNEHAPALAAGLVKDLPRGSRKRGCIAAVIVTSAIVIAWPFASTTVGDDFSYMWTALVFSQTGHIVYNGWASMILGWQVFWGALFIRIFGFSFNVLRVSMLPLSAACIYLFHNILVRFSVSPRNALFGALTLGLSPLYLPLSGSFMSDVPGLFVVLVCIAMCQRAVLAETDKSTLIWLCAAALVNVLGGTVRQICWLGVLVMVPATAWFLRRRRGVLLGALCACALGALAVFAAMHWYDHQAYSVPESLISGHIHRQTLLHLGVQELKAALVLVLITLPVSIAWLAAANGLSRRATLRDAAELGVVAAAALFIFHRDDPSTQLMPWLAPTLSSIGMQDTQGPITPPVTLNPLLRSLLSLLVVFTLIVIAKQVWRLRRERDSSVFRNQHALFWIMVPFSSCTLALMASRAAFASLQDRYLLLLEPLILVYLLRLYERTIAPRLPVLSVVVLLLYGYYGIAGLHTIWAGARSDQKAITELKDAGVPRTAIAEGFGPDEWEELKLQGHVNYDVPYPRGTFRSDVPRWDFPDVCMPFDYYVVPDIRPVYIVTSASSQCYRPSEFAPVRYWAWLPPFRRVSYIVRPAGR